MLNVRPPFEFSAEPAPIMKLVSWNAYGSRYIVAIVALPSRLETSMPSIVNLFSLALPRTVALDCRNCSVPPTSTLLMTTPGMTRAIDHTSVRFGSASSTSREMTVCFRAVDVSSSGGLTADGHAFFQRADFELEVGARHLVGVDLDVALLRRAESRELALDDVDSGHESRELIGALFVRHRCLAAADAARCRRQRHVHAGEHAAGRVGDRAADRPAPPCAIAGIAPPCQNRAALTRRRLHERLISISFLLLRSG